MDQPPRIALPTRRSIRLRGFDYASNAAYVVTICTHHRRLLFGTITDGQLQPSWLGTIVEREWQKTAEMRPGVLLDAFTLLPNHLHGILILNLPEDGPRPEERVGLVGATGGRPFQAPSAGLEAIVRDIKSAVTAAARKERPGAGQIWQRGYHDRIIRSQAELERFRQYIADNPQQWELDRYFEMQAGQASSWGAGESSSELTRDTHFNHPGVAITASSGDSGYGVSYPAASQYVTAVGGTSLTRNSRAKRGWSESAWSGAGSGCSAYEPKPSWQKGAGCANRTVIDALLWLLRTGAPWRDLPERYGSWKTVASRFYRWQKAEIWQQILGWLQQQADADGRLDWILHHVDGTMIRAHQHAAGARRPKDTEHPDEALGRSQGGFSTKIHLRVEGGGKLLAILITPGQRHEQSVFEALMETGAVKRAGRGRPRIRPDRVAGGKGYSSKKIRRYLRRRGTGAVILRQKRERRTRFHRVAYPQRNRVERLVNRLKAFRRIATRYEKRAVHYLGMLTLVAILPWL